ncbi:MAG: KH domain-containing protein [Lentisphaeria bacterium]|nr:KH domain-containing protein [Lentisphaeria bacterium]
MLFDAIKRLFSSDKKSADCSKEEHGKGCCCTSEKKEAASTVKLSDLEDFVSYVVKNLVDAPEEVKVETVVENSAKTIRISCRKDDTGKIIGKKGKTIIALRALVAGAAGRMQDRVSVEVAD